MYLLMLLATFMASIYGYNLSARPDYDRDIAKKKAASIIFKFGYQFKAVRMVIVDIINGNFKAADGADIPWILPGDMFYARFDANGVDDNEDIHTFVNQQGSEHLVYLRAKNKQGQDNIGAKDYLMAGRRVYDGSEMGFKILCLDKPMNENGSKNCISTTDADGNITKSCCHVLQDGGRYMVAYKNLTPGGLTGFQARLRWILSKRWHRRCIMTISALSAGERRRAKTKWPGSFAAKSTFCRFMPMIWRSGRIKRTIRSLIR